LILF
jgi:hypothetical protein